MWDIGYPSNRRRPGLKFTGLHLRCGVHDLLSRMRERTKVTEACDHARLSRTATRQYPAPSNVPLFRPVATFSRWREKDSIVGVSNRVAFVQWRSVPLVWCQGDLPLSAFGAFDGRRPVTAT